MHMTQEQQQVFEQAVLSGIARNAKEAYEAGCAALRRQLAELKAEQIAKQQAAQKSEDEFIASNQFSLFPQATEANS